MSKKIQLIKDAEKLQDECHKYVDAFYKEIDRPEKQYQDEVNCWMFIEFAKQQSRIQELETNLKRLQETLNLF